MKYILLFIFTISLLHSSRPSQSSPEELANMLVEAINHEDASSIRHLFHPLTVSYYEELSDDALQKQIDILLKKEISDDFEISLTPIEEVRNYDLEKDTYKFMGIPLKFSKRPNLLLDINQTVSDKKGTNRRLPLKIEGISEMIIKEKGRWFIIRPQNPTHKIKINQKN